MKTLKTTIATFIITFLILNNVSHGQNNKKYKEEPKPEKMIVFDFELKMFLDMDDQVTPKSTTPYYLKYQDDISIKVININLNKYEVTFDTTTRTYEYASEQLQDSSKESKESEVDDKNKQISKDKMNLLPDSLVILSLDAQVAIMKQKADTDFDVSKYRVLKDNLDAMVTADITAREGEIFRDQNFETFEKEKKKIILDFNEYKKSYEAFKEKSKEVLTLAKVEKLEESINVAEKNVAFLEEISGLFEGLKSENFSALFTLANIEDDLIIIKFIIKEKSDKEGKGETYSASIKVKGKWKIDSSAGALFNFISYDENYFIDSQKVIYQGQNRQKVTPVFPVVLMHFYKKGKKQFSHGVSTGFGLSEDAKAAFYLGYSFLWGENQRWVTTTGFSLRSVSRLKPKYAEGQNLSTMTNVPNESDLVEDVYQLGAFLSLTYNLSRKN